MFTVAADEEGKFQYKVLKQKINVISFCIIHHHFIFCFILFTNLDVDVYVSTRNHLLLLRLISCSNMSVIVRN